MTRAEKVAEVRALRESGLLLREVAERLGLSISAVSDYIHDPDGSKARARKRRLYSRPCIDCGQEVRCQGLLEMSRRSGRCKDCDRRLIQSDPKARLQRHGAHRFTKVYSDEFITACLRAAAVDGRLTGPMYEQWRAGRTGVPSRELIVARCGWNNAVRAAGLQPAHSPRTYRCRFTREVCLAAVAQVATELGRFPTFHEYEHIARTDPRGFPSAPTVRWRVGTWSKVYEVYSSTEAAAA